MRRVLLLHVLKLLTRVRQYHNGIRDLLTQFVQLFVSLLNFLVERLIFDLELLKVDQVKTISKLLFLLEYFFLVGEAVSQGDVLQSELIHLLILLELTLLLHSDVVLGNLLTRTTVDGILSDATLEILELGLNLFALSLLLIELSL